MCWGLATTWKCNEHTDDHEYWHTPLSCKHRCLGMSWCQSLQTFRGRNQCSQHQELESCKLLSSEWTGTSNESSVRGSFGRRSSWASSRLPEHFPVVYFSGTVSLSYSSRHRTWLASRLLQPLNSYRSKRWRYFRSDRWSCRSRKFFDLSWSSPNNFVQGFLSSFCLTFLGMQSVEHSQIVTNGEHF